MPNRQIINSWLVYPVALGRKDMNVTLADIKDTIQQYTDTYGPPDAITLSPRAAKLLPDGIDGIKIFSPGGCLAFEVWLPEKPPLITGGGITDSAQDTKIAAKTPEPVKNYVRKTRKQKIRLKILELCNNRRKSLSLKRKELCNMVKGVGPGKRARSTG